jgi:hypothetical protein
VDTSRPISFGERSIAVTLRGLYGRYEHILTRGHAPPENEAVRHGRAVGRARSIADLLASPRTALLIVSRAGMGIWQPGSDMEEAENEIAMARTQYGSGENWFKQQRRVPGEMIEEFAAAGRESLESSRP